VVSGIACRESGLRHTQPVGMGDPEYTPAEIGPTLPETERPMTAASLVVETGSKGSPRVDNPGNGGQRMREAHDFSRGRTPPAALYSSLWE